tara:strand:+ start:12209 stop:12973 length:765 start_codon:yes stop_codon:yes gene_type:complete
MLEIKRIIPKLEIKNENLIKGIQFEGLRVVGDPIKFAKKFFEDGADQIIIIDIVASLYSRKNLFKTLNKITDDIFIPITAGGGVRNLEDIEKLLEAGADRVSINTFALENQEILSNISEKFGNQFLSVLIEVKKIENKYYCMKNHGRDNSGIELDKWVEFLKTKGIGEIVIQSIDDDGMCNGLDDNLLSIIQKLKIKIPTVVGCGMGNLDHCINVLDKDYISGLTISSSLYSEDIVINKLKSELKRRKILINEI